MSFGFHFTQVGEALSRFILWDASVLYAHRAAWQVKLYVNLTAKQLLRTIDIQCGITASQL